MLESPTPSEERSEDARDEAKEAPKHCIEAVGEEHIRRQSGSVRQHAQNHVRSDFTKIEPSLPSVDGQMQKGAHLHPWR